MTDFLGFFFKDANEFFADNLAFLFRIADALEFRQETFLGVNTDEVHVKVSFEDLFHLVAFVLTKQAMVNKDAGELLTHGLVDENRSNRGINAAAHGAQDILIPHFFTNGFNLGLGKARHGPVTGKAANIKEEVAEHFLAKGRMHDFRMKLDAVEAFFLVHHGRNRAFFRMARHNKAFRYGFDIILMTHPADVVLFDPGEKARFVIEGNRGLSIFTGRTRMGNDAAQFLCHELMAIAKTEDRNTQGENTIVDRRRIFSINTVRSTGEDQGFWILGLDLIDGIAIRNDFAVNATFTDTARNQLCILGAKVNDQDKFML